MGKNEDLLWGINPVLEALRFGKRSFDRIYLVRGKRGKEVQEIITVARREGVCVSFESKEFFVRMCGHVRHQGVVACVALKKYSTAREMLERAAERQEAPFLILLDGIVDPRNLGAIIRTAEGAGAHGILLPQHRAAGLSGTVAKASSGALEYLSVGRVVNLKRAIADLKTEGLWIIGLDPHGKQNYLDADYKGPIGIVVGNEGEGIRRTVLEACDQRVSIPMRGHTSSLNASVAVGIVSYEVMRQRIPEEERRKKAQ